MMSRRSPCSKGAATPTCAVQLPRAAHLARSRLQTRAKEPTLRPEPDEGFVDLPGALEAALATSAAMRDEQQPSARGQCSVCLQAIARAAHRLSGWRAASCAATVDLIVART
jgi:hypothetical protein